jgi:hypothetical protein
MDTRAEAGYAPCWTTEGISGEKTVTEAEWLDCTDPQKMLDFLLGRTVVLNSISRNPKISGRKLGLITVACCYRVWGQMDELSRQAALVLERFADGLATRIDLNAAMERAAWEAQASPVGWMRAAWEASKTESADLLRDIYNPRRLLLDPAILAWNNATVVRLAQAAYDERHLPAGTLDTGRLAVLADALEEAGCTNADILGHLRGPGPHVRGCWPVDLCSGKS